MRHDCDIDGCFEKKHRCQLGLLDHLLPAGNGFTDLDGFCHINGKRLFLEWKKSSARSPSGKQEEALLDLSNIGLVLVAFGDPMTMEPDTLQIWDRGKKLFFTSREEPNKIFTTTISEWGLKAKYHWNK